MLKVRVLPLVVGLLVSLAVVPGALAQRVVESKTPNRPRDVIFLPTLEPIASVMLNLANVTSRDLVYDLGCGDGALVIAAAKRGARVVGVDIDPQRIREATANVRAAGVQNRVTLIRGDIFDPAIKIGDASVVMLYLRQAINEKLAPRLKGDLKSGARVVSHAFSMGEGWPPDSAQQVAGTTVYLWTVR